MKAPRNHAAWCTTCREVSSTLQEQELSEYLASCTYQFSNPCLGCLPGAFREAWTCPAALHFAPAPSVDAAHAPRGTHRTRGPPDAAVGMNVGAPLTQVLPQRALFRNTACAPVEAYPSCSQPQARRTPDVTPKSKRIAPPTANPGRARRTPRRIIVRNHNIAGFTGIMVMYARRSPRSGRYSSGTGASRDAALPLHRVHHVLLLARNTFPIWWSVHVRIHHVQHGRKGSSACTLGSQGSWSSLMALASACPVSNGAHRPLGGSGISLG